MYYDEKLLGAIQHKKKFTVPKHILLQNRLYSHGVPSSVQIMMTHEYRIFYDGSTLWLPKQVCNKCPGALNVFIYN